MNKEILKERLEWIVETRPNPKENVYGYCGICSKYQSEAIGLTLNGRLPIAFKPGIRFSGVEFLQRFIDHHHSESHKKSCELKKLEVFWKEGNEDEHPWLRIIRKQL